MTDKQPVNENLPTIAELRAEIIIELTCDTEDERDDCIDAKLLNDRLTVAEAVQEACAQSADDWEIETGGGAGMDIRMIDLAEIVKGNP